ncbi:MAG TPA: hypothetical protein VLZ31_05720 [Microbacteriaceae bacterium]|nr:hypothetical protein [Microbacteriaceae bacterium]
MVDRNYSFATDAGDEDYDEKGNEAFTGTAMWNCKRQNYYPKNDGS